MPETDNELRQMVADVAGSYFMNSHVAPDQIPNVMKQIAMALQNVGGAEQSEQPQQSEEPQRAAKMTPAQVRKSMTPEALISFEDGRPYKTLRRHLAGRGLSPEQYREKHGLPNDYPMVSPNYSAMRSEMAKSLGLGQKGSQARNAKGGASGGGRGRKAASNG